MASHGYSKDDMRVYIKREPQREIVLATSKYGLSFKSADPWSTSAERKTVVVPDFFHLRDREAELAKFESPTRCFGCLGLISHGDEVFVSVITDRSRAAKPTPYRTVYNIHRVEFFGLNQEFTEQDETVHPLAALRKFFSLGGFLYSSDFDLTAPVQATQEKSSNFVTPVDESFMWNQFMTANLNKSKAKLTQEDQLAVYESGFLTTLIRGFASTVTVQVDDIPGTLTILSKQSWLRAGTRYNSRGIDDDGNVANFVESETILWLKNGQQFGFVQLRGSVPLFWEQDPQLLTAKINITRPVESTEQATRKHFDNLISRFGAVHIVDLLGSSSGSRGTTEGIDRISCEGASASGASVRSDRSMHSVRSMQSIHSGLSSASTSSIAGSASGVGTATEADLSLRYQHVAESIQGLRYTHFDFHKEVAGIGYSAASKLVDQIQASMLEFGFYSANPTNESAETEQIGVFRVNCLDCLDRTNLVQQLISKDALDLFLDFNDMYGNKDLWEAHANLWADNGDQLSQNYTGTGALKSSFTRSGRMGIAGALSDVSKSVSRLYINNFVDKTRQNAIDELLGRSEGQQPVKIFDPINDHVWEEMKQRTEEYSSESQITVFAGTFNVNGKSFGSGSHGEDQIANWLFPAEAISSNGRINTKQLPDLYIIGFQELVELTTSQILSADPSRKEYWEHQVSECLNSVGENYVLLRSGQLVGTAIMLFVKRSHLNSVTEVEGTSKKTALGGITGNKGGVAVGFKYSNTRFMVVNAHLAAGMHNLEDRHNDYKLLLNGLRLNGNRRIKDADIVIWMGDFNYRIDLPSDTIRKMIKQKNNQETINKLLTFDQLTKQMEMGETFPYFQESNIKFMPTYKYDPGTDTFDSSDKQRAPAWTDRVLVKGQNVRKRAYNSVPSIKFSDHRPVYALFDITVSIVDEARADRLYSQLYDRRRDYVLSRGDSVFSEFAAPNSLQFPSSDTQKWWAGGGMATKVPINAPKDMVLNPEKLNPFSKEPDFVQRPPVPSKQMNSSYSPSPPLLPTRSPASGSTTGSIPPVPPPSRNSGPTRKPVPPIPGKTSELSLLDVPISSDSSSPTRDSTPANKPSSSRTSSIKSNTASLMDSDDSRIPYKSLI